MTLIIQDDDFQETNCPELDSNGEIEVHWDDPELPKQWSYRHAEWEPKVQRDDPKYKRSWTKLEPVTKDSRQGIWEPYSLIVKKFSLKNTNLPAEEILKLSPPWLRSLTSRVNPPIKCKRCENTTFCSHDIGSSGNA